MYNIFDLIILFVMSLLVSFIISITRGDKEHILIKTIISTIFIFFGIIIVRAFWTDSELSITTNYLFFIELKFLWKE